MPPTSDFFGTDLQLTASMCFGLIALVANFFFFWVRAGSVEEIGRVKKFKVTKENVIVFGGLQGAAQKGFDITTAWFTPKEAELNHNRGLIVRCMFGLTVMTALNISLMFSGILTNLPETGFQGALMDNTNPTRQAISCIAVICSGINFFGWFPQIRFVVYHIWDITEGLERLKAGQTKMIEFAPA